MVLIVERLVATIVSDSMCQLLQKIVAKAARQTNGRIQLKLCGPMATLGTQNPFGESMVAPPRHMPQARATIFYKFVRSDRTAYPIRTGKVPFDSVPSLEYSQVDCIILRVRCHVPLAHGMCYDILLLVLERLNGFGPNRFCLTRTDDNNIM